MKLIATADWHIHEFADFSRTLGVSWSNHSQRFIEVDDSESKPMNSRLFNILNGLCDIRDYAQAHNITQVINAGDVFHKRGSISVTAFNAMHKVLESFYRQGISMYIIAGNHDQVDASVSPETSIHTFKDIACVIEKPQIMSIAQGMDTLDLVLVPYSKDKKFILESIHDLKYQVSSKKSILVAHLGVTGGTVGSGMYMMSDEYSMKELEYDKWKFVILGHYHQPQMLEYNTVYCGTPVQNTFNDELPDDYKADAINPGCGLNGFYVLDTDLDNTDPKSMQFVPVNAPRFITVHSIVQMQHYPQSNFFRIKATSQEADEVISSTEESTNVRVEVEKDYDQISRSNIGLCDTLEDAVKKYAQENYHGSDTSVLKTGLDILHSVMDGGEVSDI